MSCLLSTVLQWTLGCMYPFGPCFCPYTCPGEGLQDHVVTLFLVFWEASILFSTVAMKWSESRSVVSDSLWPHGLYSPWNSLGRNTGMGGLSLLQGIFLTQWSKPRSPALQSDSLPAEPQGKPTVAVPIYISTNILFTLSPAFIVCRFFDQGL